jgi:hypothetical protein
MPLDSFAKPVSIIEPNIDIPILAGVVLLVYGAQYLHVLSRSPRLGCD